MPAIQADAHSAFVLQDQSLGFRRTHGGNVIYVPPAFLTESDAVVAGHRVPGSVARGGDSNIVEDVQWPAHDWLLGLDAGFGIQLSCIQLERQMKNG